MSKNKRVAIFVLAILLLPFCASAQEFLNLKKLSDRATKAELPLNTAEIVFVARTNDLVITSSSPTYDRFSPPYHYLVVCDRTGHIVAVLSPGRDERMNLKTQQADKVTNYWGHKIIGFTL